MEDVANRQKVGRKSSYKKKRLRKQRPGRIERLKEAVCKKGDEVDQLNRRAQSLRKLAIKTVTTNKLLKRSILYNKHTQYKHNM